MTHTKDTALKLSLYALQKPNVSGDAVEWLCERCNWIHPSQTGGILQPCPCCKSAMTPTSFNLREIKRLRAMLDAKSPVAQPEPVQPVAWMFEDDEDNGHKTFRQTPPSPEVVAYLAKWNRPAWVPLYTNPPAQPALAPLTNEQITKAFNEAMALRPKDASNAETNRIFVRCIEAAHGIKKDH